MVPVAVDASVSENCVEAPMCKIISVSSNEPEKGLGSGDKAPDWEITGDLTVNLRAERSLAGSGREYTITMECTGCSRQQLNRDCECYCASRPGQEKRQEK